MAGRNEKIYGRAADIEQLEHSLAGGGTVVLRGHSGIGKSALCQILHVRAIERGHISLLHTVHSVASPLEYLLQDFARQVLGSLTHLTANKVDEIANTLTRNTDNLTWLIATQAFLELISTADRTGQPVALADKLANAGASSFVAISERPRQVSSTDLQAGFLNLISALSEADIAGTLTLDRIEACSDSVESAILAISAFLPTNWSLLIAINDEIPDGIQMFERMWPALAYQKATIVQLGPLGVPALEQWYLDLHEVAPPYAELETVINNCQGRPLLLREWVESDSPMSPATIIWDRLGPYYQHRLRSLSRAGRQLVRDLAVLPSTSDVPLTFIQKVLGISSVSDTFEVVDELAKGHFIEPSTERPDHYRFVHELTKRQVASVVPVSVIEESSARLAAALSEDSKMFPKASMDYMRIMLLRQSGQLREFLSLAIPFARTVGKQGSFKSAIEIYGLCIEVSRKLQSEPSLREARLGLAHALYRMGYYQDALSRLAECDGMNLADATRAALLKGQILLRLNRYTECRAQLFSARQGFKKLGDITGEIQVEKEENVILRDLEMYEEAETQADELVNLALALNVSPNVLASCYRAQARSSALLSHGSKALFACERALRIALQIGSVDATGNAHLARGEALRHSGRPEQAIPAYRAAISSALGTGNKDSYLWSALGLSDSILLSGNVDAALTPLQEIREVIALSAEGHPLEYAHFQFSLAVLKHLGAGVPDAVSLSNALINYGAFGLRWPQIYITELLNHEKPVGPKRF